MQGMGFSRITLDISDSSQAVEIHLSGTTRFEDARCGDVARW